MMRIESVLFFGHVCKFSGFEAFWIAQSEFWACGHQLAGGVSVFSTIYSIVIWDREGITMVAQWLEGLYTLSF
jgi:hypothetical protein